MLSKPQFDAGVSSGKSKHPRCDIQIFQTMEEVTNQIYDIFVEIQPLVLHEETFTSRCCEQAESAKTVFESLWSKWHRAMPPCQDELHLSCMPGLWCFQLEKSLLYHYTWLLFSRALFSSVPMYCLPTHVSGKILQISPDSARHTCKSQLACFGSIQGWLRRQCTGWWKLACNRLKSLVSPGGSQRSRGAA